MVEVETVMKACKKVEQLKEKAKAERQMAATDPADEKALEKLLEVLLSFCAPLLSFLTPDYFDALKLNYTY